MTMPEANLNDLHQHVAMEREAQAARANETLDQAHERLGHTALRVSLADLEANIVDVEIIKHVAKSGQVLRWAVITTRSGFAVAGEPSASVSSANDSAELGEKFAIENARRALWPLMGYALRERLHLQAQPPHAPQVMQDAR
jgi:hypothetical protein